MTKEQLAEIIGDIFGEFLIQALLGLIGITVLYSIWKLINHLEKNEEKWEDCIILLKLMFLLLLVNWFDYALIRLWQIHSEIWIILVALCTNDFFIKATILVSTIFCLVRLCVACTKKEWVWNRFANSIIVVTTVALAINFIVAGEPNS